MTTDEPESPEQSVSEVTARIAAKVLPVVEAVTKQFQAIRFREGDLITIGDVTLECATHKGRRVLLAPKGAKVRKGKTTS